MGGGEGGSGWGTRVCLWRIHFNIWQNQYNIVKFKNKIKLKKKRKEKRLTQRKKKRETVEEEDQGIATCTGCGRRGVLKRLKK